MHSKQTNPSVEMSCADEFLDDVVGGLSRRQKSLPCRWLYDARGSDLFEQITRLPEYYLTRVETRILTDVAPSLAETIGPNATLVEYGAGASVKTRLLLDALDRPSRYVPIDVSRDFLLQTAERLRTDYPDLDVSPVVADFLSPLSLPLRSDDRGTSTGFFPGSTIGNLSDTEIQHFLVNAARMLGPNSQLIIGYDRVKPLGRLLPAYDDAAGVTAQFNLNLLHRINLELGADFKPENFAHEARWNESFSRVEMHLVSTTPQTVHLANRRFDFRAGETIHTENSRKFSAAQMDRLCAAAGYAVRETFTDPDALFAVSLMAPQTRAT